jgi:hypothetical protein
MLRVTRYRDSELLRPSSHMWNEVMQSHVGSGQKVRHAV